MRVRALAVAAVLVGCVALTGCGGGGSSVKGKVVNGGKAYNPEADGDMTIMLSGGGAESYSGKVEPDGSFTLKSSTGGGVPAGKYKVTVTKYPSKAEMKPGTPPMPANKTYPEEWDVGSSSEFTLDVSKLK